MQAGGLCNGAKCSPAQNFVILVILLVVSEFIRRGTAVLAVKLLHVLKEGDIEM